MSRAAKIPAATATTPEVLGQQLVAEMLALRGSVSNELHSYADEENHWEVTRLHIAAEDIIDRAVARFAATHDQDAIAYAASTVDALFKGARLLAQHPNVWQHICERADAIGTACDSGIYRGLKNRWPAASTAASEPAPEEPSTIGAVPRVAQDAVWELDALLRLLPDLVTPNENQEHLHIRGLAGRMLRLTHVLMSFLDGDKRDEEEVERLGRMVTLEGITCG